jgi:hypothetical protein
MSEIVKAVIIYNLMQCLIPFVLIVVFMSAYWLFDHLSKR